MPQRITPSKIVTISKEGEVHVTITLELNINLNTTGIPQVSGQQVPESAVKKDDEDDERIAWQVPEFDSVSDFQFGKDVDL